MQNDWYEEEVCLHCNTPLNPGYSFVCNNCGRGPEEMTKLSLGRTWWGFWRLFGRFLEWLDNIPIIGDLLSGYVLVAIFVVGPLFLMLWALNTFW